MLKLADAALFNVIVGNADAHAKNFSLLRKAPEIGQGNEVVLAPFYDLVATRARPELSPRLAMRFGGAANLEEVDADSFNRFAQDAGIAASFVRRRAGALAEAVRKALEAGLTVPGLDSAAVATLVRDSAERAAIFQLKVKG